MSTEPVIDEKTCKWNTEYNKDQRILIVGDGDFSFSSSLALALTDGSNIIATSYDTYSIVVGKYQKAEKNIRQLSELGCKVIHGLDATVMSTHPFFEGIKFDVIVFNFPHAGFRKGHGDSSRKAIKMHQNLVGGFLKNACTMLTAEGQVHITHKTIDPFSRWNIEGLAVEEGFMLAESEEFDINAYPGYENKYGDGHTPDNKFWLGDCLKYKFIKKQT